MHNKTIIDLTGIPVVFNHHATQITRFQGGTIGRVEFTVDPHTRNMSIEVLTPVTEHVTIFAPIASENVSASEGFVRLLMALSQLRSEGATEFHIVFIRPLFDGSGSMHSPSTIGFKILADFLNGRPDIKKITLMGPHSSHSECMLSPSRRVIPHQDLVDLSELSTLDRSEVVVVSPDIGGFYNANGFAAQYSSQPPCILNDSVQTSVDLTDKTVVIFDDMIVTGKKILSTYTRVSQMNPSAIKIVITHIMSKLATTVLREILNDPRVTVHTSYTGEYFLSHERFIISDIHTHLLEAFTERYETHNRN